MPKYETYDSGGPYHHRLFRTINLNPYGRFNQNDDLYQVLRVTRPELSDQEILEIITEERIRRSEMNINPAFIDRVMKDCLPGYHKVKAGKK